MWARWETAVWAVFHGVHTLFVGATLERDVVARQKVAEQITNSGVNAVLVEMANATQELAHDIAVHIGFARPKYLSRTDIPQDIVAHERQTLETISRNEGKPEAALPKIIEGRLNGYYKDVALLDQPYAKDDKQTITQLIGSATIVRFAQVEIG